MAMLGSVLNVVFIIVCILLILLILMQSGRSSGMSLFGGSASQTAFGANSADVLTKTTGVLIVLFMVIGLGMSLIKSKENNYQKIQEKIRENAGAPAEDTSMGTENGTGNKSPANETDKPGNSNPAAPAMNSNPQTPPK
ncbi:MAG: preprotein translocase subunit SecG [Spirochaetia bacterium]|nr:preprotein translocase subunit SecG [Spirochaetia bacterium]